MKKRMLLLAIAGFMMAATPSCKKEETPSPAATTQTIDVSLKTGESYTFSFPGNSNAPFEITTEAQHASISQLCCDSAGNKLYKYTPEAGFSGTDQVILSNDKEHPQNCQHPQGPPPPPPSGATNGGCDHGNDNENHYIVIVNFTIKDTTSSGSSSATRLNRAGE
jgi:hypothetical protein